MQNADMGVLYTPKDRANVETFIITNITEDI